MIIIPIGIYVHCTDRYDTSIMQLALDSRYLLDWVFGIVFVLRLNGDSKPG